MARTPQQAKEQIENKIPNVEGQIDGVIGVINRKYKMVNGRIVYLNPQQIEQRVQILVDVLSSEKELKSKRRNLTSEIEQ